MNPGLNSLKGGQAPLRLSFDEEKLGIGKLINETKVSELLGHPVLIDLTKNQPTIVGCSRNQRLHGTVYRYIFRYRYFGDKSTGTLSK